MLTDEASRLGKMCRMDAIGECERRPNYEEQQERTPASELNGVQLEKSSKIGRYVIECEASKSGKLSRTDAV